MFIRKKLRFFNVGLKLLVYILYVPMKNVMFFQYGIKNFFSLNTST